MPCIAAVPLFLCPDSNQVGLITIVWVEQDHSLHAVHNCTNLYHVPSLVFTFANLNSHRHFSIFSNPLIVARAGPKSA